MGSSHFLAPPANYAISVAVMKVPGLSVCVRVPCWYLAAGFEFVVNAVTRHLMLVLIDIAAFDCGLARGGVVVELSHFSYPSQVVVIIPM